MAVGKNIHLFLAILSSIFVISHSYTSQATGNNYIILQVAIAMELIAVHKYVKRDIIFCLTAFSD